MLLISNAVLGKESIEVGHKDNLNARLVFFSTIYTDSPAKTIHIVREAVRDSDNVSDKITPIVRIRQLGDSSIDWEIKYWLDDYARYNDTDALVRQRVWYALRRNGLTFAFPTRTLYLERAVSPRPVTAEDEIADRLSAVDIFSPLSPDELRQLAKATAGHIFAPGETLIRAGEEGSSMFVVHNGRVAVQISDRFELELPALGRLVLNDAETGEVVEINTGDARKRAAFAERQARAQGDLARLFRSAGIDAIQLRTDQPYAVGLARFFETRERRRLHG